MNYSFQHVLLLIAAVSCSSTAFADPSVAPAAPAPQSFGSLTGTAPTTDLTNGMVPLSPNSVVYSPDVTSAYVLGPGDSISISVTPQDRYSLGTASVPQDGTIMYPRLGIVSVAGKTVGELKTEIEDRLAKYCVDPDVTVQVTALRPEPVYVTGGVTSPRILDVRAAGTVAKAITLAGGATDINELQHVTIFRGNQTLHANVYQVLIDGEDNGENVALEPDDLVVVPINTARIEVLGAVNNPGVYNLAAPSGNEGPEHLSDALSQAGGTSRSGARVHEIRLIRASASGAPVVTEWDYGKFMQFGDLTQNPVLQDKDMIVVPNSQHVTQTGDVFPYLSLYGFFKAML